MTRDQLEVLWRIAQGHGEDYNNDELLHVGVGYGIPGPLTNEQMMREASEILEGHYEY